LPKLKKGAKGLTTYLGWACWAKAKLTPPEIITTARIKVKNRVRRREA
jgi:hypothetical protein